MTGLSADTLRTWERRYGFPTPSRSPSGHRRYSRPVFERLLIIKSLVEQGHRPSRAVGLSLEESRSVELPVEQGPSVTPSLGYGLSVRERASEICAGVLLKCEKLDAAGMEELLDLSWQQLGAMETLEQVVQPLLGMVGQRWRAGRLGIHHEHLFSARVSAFLTRQWMPLSDQARGPLIVMATPPGEEHELGLHLAATYFALEGARILFIGQNTPAEALIEAAQGAQGDALALSLSALYPQDSLELYLNHLLQHYASTRVLIGGAGAFRQQWPCVQLAAPHEIRFWLERHGGASMGALSERNRDRALLSH